MSSSSVAITAVYGTQHTVLILPPLATFLYILLRAHPYHSPIHARNPWLLILQSLVTMIVTLISYVHLAHAATLPCILVRLCLVVLVPAVSMLSVLRAMQVAAKYLDQRPTSGYFASGSRQAEFIAMDAFPVTRSGASVVQSASAATAMSSQARAREYPNLNPVLSMLREMAVIFADHKHWLTNLRCFTFALIHLALLLGAFVLVEILQPATGVQDQVCAGVHPAMLCAHAPWLLGVLVTFPMTLVARDRYGIWMEVVISDVVSVVYIFALLLDVVLSDGLDLDSPAILTTFVWSLLAILSLWWTSVGMPLLEAMGILGGASSSELSTQTRPAASNQHLPFRTYRKMPSFDMLHMPRPRRFSQSMKEPSETASIGGATTCTMDTRLDWTEFARILSDPETLERLTQFAVQDFSVEGLLFYKRLQRLREKIRTVNNVELTSSGLAGAKRSLKLMPGRDPTEAQSLRLSTSLLHSRRSTETLESSWISEYRSIMNDFELIYRTFLRDASEYEVNVTANAREHARDGMRVLRIRQTILGKSGALTTVPSLAMVRLSSADVERVFGPAESEVVRLVYEYTYPRYLQSEMSVVRPGFVNRMRSGSWIKRSASSTDMRSPSVISMSYSLAVPPLEDSEGKQRRLWRMYSSSESLVQMPVVEEGLPMTTHIATPNSLSSPTVLSEEARVETTEPWSGPANPWQEIERQNQVFGFETTPPADHTGRESPGWEIAGHDAEGKARLWRMSGIRASHITKSIKKRHSSLAIEQMAFSSTNQDECKAIAAGARTLGKPESVHGATVGSRRNTRVGAEQLLTRGGQREEVEDGAIGSKRDINLRAIGGDPEVK